MRVHAGDRGPAWSYGPVTREDMVRFAGAAYDFVPLHFDDEYARRAGYPAVFAHGTMVGGMLGSYLTRWFGPGSVRRLRVRFLELVRPGDVLTAEGEVTSTLGSAAEVRLAMLRGDGIAAVRGEATVAITP